MSKQYILNKIKEPSTWVGIVAALTATGVNLTPEFKELIITVGTTIGSILCFFINEKPIA